MSEEQTIVGNSVSSTVMSNSHVVTLPAASIAVYVTVVVPTGKKSPELCEDVIVTPQLSVSVGTVQLTIAPQSPASLDTVMSCGQSEITGASVSSTVTVNVQIVVLTGLASSVNVYVTVVVPTGNTSPELCVLVTVTTPQLSVAVGTVHVTSASHKPASVDTKMFVGQLETTGASLSITVISNSHIVMLPEASSAV